VHAVEEDAVPNLIYVLPWFPSDNGARTIDLQLFCPNGLQLNVPWASDINVLAIYLQKCGWCPTRVHIGVDDLAVAPLFPVGNYGKFREIIEEVRKRNVNLALAKGDGDGASPIFRLPLASPSHAFVIGIEIAQVTTNFLLQIGAMFDEKIRQTRMKTTTEKFPKGFQAVTLWLNTEEASARVVTCRNGLSQSGRDAVNEAVPNLELYMPHLALLL
jgi:hypothetical protein